jgi:hypothetical protein
MIALGGTIGIGLVIGSGTALSQGENRRFRLSGGVNDPQVVHLEFCSVTRLSVRPLGICITACI